MSYSNEFLRDFAPVFQGIIKAKGFRPETVELEIIDEEPEDRSIFEPADVLDVLEQLSPGLNFLSIYTDRPVYFEEFAETMYEENGLIVMIYLKEQLKMNSKGSISRQNFRSCMGKLRGEASPQIILDFEWEGSCYYGQMRPGRYYIPVHKKPWETAENLDIMVPIGYNTVIVKGIRNKKEEPGLDRFEAAFYSS